MDLGTDADRDTGPVGDAQPPVELGGPPWRPWWVAFRSWAYAVWALIQLAVMIGTVFFSGRTKGPTEIVVWSVIVGSLGLIWMGGVAVLALRPEVARRPTRPHSPAARACFIAAGVIGAAGYLGVFVLASRSVLGVLAVAAASTVLVIVLTVTAQRLNDRAEAADHLLSRPANSDRAG